MADLNYYFGVGMDSTSLYTPLQTHVKDLNDVDERLDILESENQSQITKISQLETRIGPLTDDDAKTWHDFIAPVITGGADVLSDLFTYWLNQQDVKKWLTDLLARQLGIPPDGDTVVIEPDQILAAPEIPVNFLTLSSNCFAVDRTTGQIHKDWGVTVDRDLNLLSSGNVNILDPGTLTQSDAFGVAYSGIMTNTAKWQIMNMNDISLKFHKGTFDQTLGASNFTSSNIKCKSFRIQEIDDGVFGVTVPAEIREDGTISATSLNIANNNFVVRENGEVLVNGKLVCTGGGSVLVEDSCILPSSSKCDIESIACGNLGKPDVADFVGNTVLHGDGERSDPLAFMSLADSTNRAEMLHLTHPEFEATSAESISRAMSKMSSIKGTGPQDWRDTFYDDDEDSFWEIDIHTGKVIDPSDFANNLTVPAPLPKLAYPISKAPIVMPQIEDHPLEYYFGEEAENAPLHWLNFGVLFPKINRFEDNAFAPVLEFEDNAVWNTEAERQNSWTKVLSVLFKQTSGPEAMQEHIGLDKTDTLFSFGSAADWPNVDDGTDAPVMRFDSAADWDNTFSLHRFSSSAF
jgi:hypothetical protein